EGDRLRAPVEGEAPRRGVEEEPRSARVELVEAERRRRRRARVAHDRGEEATVGRERGARRLHAQLGEDARRDGIADADRLPRGRDALAVRAPREHAQLVLEADRLAERAAREVL